MTNLLELRDFANTPIVVDLDHPENKKSILENIALGS
jgi:hypothetical protein